MEIKIISILKTNEVTISELYVNGIYLCDTLEDRVRPLPKVCPYTSKGLPCKCKEKVYKKTAIPEGTYKVGITYSNKYSKKMIEVFDVPHFLGIRIHCGNTTDDTSGCILVGTWEGNKVDWLSNSKIQFKRLYKLVKAAVDKKEQINLQIIR